MKTPKYPLPLPKKVVVDGEDHYPVRVSYSGSRGWEFHLANTPSGIPFTVCHAPTFKAGGAKTSGRRCQYHW